ncbi:MAG: histidinol dehydrogenase [Candidatus Adiutrix sp.]|jgi:histidinol dehydrogenase|nr:histidinol dehydrogenase [Candidatus Adiutrix sp.]
MSTLEKPIIEVESLAAMTPDRRAKIMARSTAGSGAVAQTVAEILARLRQAPEAELRREYGRPGLEIKDFLVTPAEIEAAYRALPREVLEALTTAAGNIRRFHQAQLERSMWFEEFAPGLIAGRLTRPLERVGVYIPGGRAAYPSSALMNIIPARVAGVSEIIAATPPGPDFEARPEILAAAHLAGADRVYKMGGAWAVGAMAYGLAGLPRVDKIVGPGSAWVTAAKLAVFGEVDIDLPAGPSEGFIIADDSAPAEWLAWDFLSQLEHDPLAAAVLATTSEKLAAETARRVAEVFPGLERREIAAESLRNGAAIVTAESLEEIFDFCNEYAPEHLQLVLRDPFTHLARVRHAGSVFLGPYAPIAGGDYAVGTNHVLPTGGAARMFSGLSADSFLKKITFQHLTPEALEALIPTVTTLAEAEGLPAHARAMAIRRRR